MANLMTEAAVKKGESIELTVESAAYEGVAVGRVGGFVVFVRGAVPGDRVRVQVRRKKRRFAEAILEEVIEASPHRIEARCRHFGVCGGCRWQNADYALQLEFKRDQVRDLMERVGGFPQLEIRPTLPSPEPYFYRNKMEFSFGSSRWLTREEIEGGGQISRGFALGLHIPKRFDKILDVHECHLQSELSARIVNWTRDWAKEQGWEPYDSRSHEGYARNLAIRTGQRTGQLMVHLVTRSHLPERMKPFSDRIAAEFPSITTIVNSVNATRSPVAAGEETVYEGPGHIEEKIGDLSFRVSPTTFFQPNTLQAERLYEVARTFAALTGNEVLFDLYSGIGCIGLFLASEAKTVVGVEQYGNAVQEARSNALYNRIENVFFYEADADHALSPSLLERHGQPDVVVLDPPRVGVSRQVCDDLLRILPKRIVYVSCNPATQARDLKVLSAAFSVTALQPVDMFPQTYHIENVALLERRM